MRRTLALAALTLLTLACSKPEPAKPASGAQGAGAAPGATGAQGAQQAGAPAAQAGAQQALRGKVLEKTDVSQYSYLKLATGSGEVWAAVNKTGEAKVGEEVQVVNAFPMKDFESKELNKKFDVVYFGSLGGGAAAGAQGAAGGTPPGHGAMGGAPGGMPAGMTASGEAPSPQEMKAQHQAAAGGPADVKVQKVAKATGADARTVEELWTQRGQLKGKSVTVRGQVVKFTPVMGKNFLHLRDGTGTAGKDNDVTVTTSDPVNVGDVVTVKGVLSVDKDFGSGYAYPILLDDAKVTK